MSRARWYVALAGSLLAACDDRVLRAFEPRAPALGGSSDVGGRGGVGGTGDVGGSSDVGGTGGDLGNNPEAGAGRGGTTSVDPMAGAGPTGPSAPPLIDDFEDGDPRAKEPLGWWYPVNDKTSNLQGFAIEPVTRDATTVYALRTYGSGFRDWGAAVGVNLIGDGEPLNALSYEQLCFAARVEAGSSTLIQVHFLRDAVHYTQEVSLSENWNRYCLRLDAFLGPDDAALVPEELTALQFFFAPGSAFAFVLDDVELAP